MNTQEQLSEWRAASVAFIKEQFNEDVKEFTCDDCSAKTTCEFAFDPYNTNGDCLAGK